MINRILGTLFTLAIVALMVFAVLNWGNYRSMCFKPKATESEELPQRDSTIVDEELFIEADTMDVTQPAETQPAEPEGI